MNIRRIFVLLGKEFIHGPKNFMFIWAIVAPLAFTLVATLAFGTLFSDNPKLGIMDEGDSRLVVIAQELDSITTREYKDIPSLKQATRSGSIDLCIVLPQNFDDIVMKKETSTIEAYVWGESLAKDRIILPATISNLIRELAGQEVPLEIVSVTLGGEASTPWSERLIPFLVLMGVFFGGLMLPSTSLIEEKQKKTFEAIVITPASTSEIFIAKGIMGIVLSVFMGVAILLLNQAFGANSLLLVAVLFLGAIMAAELGLICGALIKDITTLFTIWKSGGILLFGPAIVYMFPQIPEWIGNIFPTYYALQPVVELSLRSGNWSDIALNVFILIGIDIILVFFIALAIRRLMQRS
ncbi:MAG: ABC transporter permease [Dehalococcoidia bacterium]|nr:MAG: ABC transporter permease [Dehalococcoidia bacterium]